MTASGWYTGVAVADVNGDGRPDVFVAGYARPYDPVPNSLAGFPTNLVGVRDLLYLNEGNGPNGRARFREVGVQAGLEASGFSHGLGATFLDVNGDGRPDLYVANDEDPNQLYVDVPWPGGAKADPARLGFRFENRAAASGMADPYAGMGVAVDGAASGPLDLFVTNSRHEPSAAFARTTASSFTNARPDFDPALGTGFAGWGDSFVDLRNSGTSDLVLATGNIPIKSLQKDAGQVKVIAPFSGNTVARYGVARIVAVAVPPWRAPGPWRLTPAYRLAACTPATGGRSIATVWDETAVDVLRSGAASEPVQARDLFDVSSAMWDAWKASTPGPASARDAAISYAAYRVLLWDASFDSNLS